MALTSAIHIHASTYSQVCVHAMKMIRSRTVIFSQQGKAAAKQAFQRIAYFTVERGFQQSRMMTAEASAIAKPII